MHIFLQVIFYYLLMGILCAFVLDTIVQYLKAKEKETSIEVSFKERFILVFFWPVVIYKTFME